jgi:hypothetical protein
MANQLALAALAIKPIEWVQLYSSYPDLRRFYLSGKGSTINLDMACNALYQRYFVIAQRMSTSGQSTIIQDEAIRSAWIIHRAMTQMALDTSASWANIVIATDFLSQEGMIFSNINKK